MDNLAGMDLLIFDFDGVIVDSETIANTTLARALTELGHPTTLEDSLRLYMGRRWDDCARAIEAEIGRPLPEEFAARRRAEIRAWAASELTAVAGAVDFVRGLGAGRRCIASSSTPAWLALCLEHIGLAAHFGDKLFSAAVHVERGKPHPDLFLYAAREMGAAPARTVVIEDSRLGVEAGVAAGMTVIGLLAGTHIRDGHAERLTAAGAHHLAQSYGEVRAVLDRLSVG